MSGHPVLSVLVGLSLGLAPAAVSPGPSPTHPPLPTVAVSPTGPESIAHRESWSWIRQQQGTGTAVTGSSWVRPDAAYPSAHTGAVSGQVTLVASDAVFHHDVLVHVFVVTDTWYPSGIAEVSDDGTFTLPWVFPGAKVFQVRERETGAVLAESAPDTGLLRSFDAPAGHHLFGRTYTYDQALALVTAQAENDAGTAADLAAGLTALQVQGGPHDGAFVVQASSLDPASALPELRTGTHAVAAYALLRHLETLRPDDPTVPALRDAANRAVDWLLARQVHEGAMDGLLLGGYGTWGPHGFDPGAKLPWASTEHALDAWHTLVVAERVLDREDVRSARAALESALLDTMWAPGHGGFLQGWQPGGPDRTRALDVDSWGSLVLGALGSFDHRDAALARTEDFRAADGPSHGHGPVVGPAPVWAEGSAGVALALARADRTSEARAVLAGLNGLRTPEGGYRAATRVSDLLSMTDLPSVGGTSWVLLAGHEVAGRPAIWDDVPPEGSEP